MSHPDVESLADAALGLDEPPSEVRRHLGRCAACVATVAGLRRAAELVSSAAALPPTVWEAPPPRVWERVAVTVASGRRSRRIWPWAAGMAGMAAAGIAVGLLTGRAMWDIEPAAGTTVAQAQLDTLDSRQRLGEASVVRTDGRMDLQVATTTPLEAGDGYLEVWLINNDGRRMVSVGVLDADSRTFPISQDLLAQGYVVVDISREPFDDQPEHSGDSLLRGTLPT